MVLLTHIRQKKIPTNIEIHMYLHHGHGAAKNEHGPPHVHVVYTPQGGFESRIFIADLKVEPVDGERSIKDSTVLKYAKKWIVKHRKELLKKFEEAMNGIEPEKMDGAIP